MNWQKLLLANIPREGEGAGAGGAGAGQQQQQQQAQPWHTGVEAETLGFWQNKGLPLDDPKAFGAKLTEMYRGLEKHIGAPADQILRLPKADKPDEVKAFWGKLGAAEAKDYDLSGVKFKGEPLEAAFADTLRNSFAANFVPKDRAAIIAADVAKYIESQQTQRETVDHGKLTAEKAKLDALWGPNKDYNHLKAMDGARITGISPEGVKALESQIGYAATMEHFRKLGMGVREADFIEGNRGPNGQPVTREAAMSKKAELMADPGWGKRYVAGDAQAKQEMDALNIMIDGQAA
jgi:hypothetical protein